MCGYSVYLSTKRYVKVWKKKNGYVIRFANHKGKVTKLALSFQAMNVLISMVEKLEGVEVCKIGGVE